MISTSWGRREDCEVSILKTTYSLAQQLADRCSAQGAFPSHPAKRICWKHSFRAFIPTPGTPFEPVPLFPLLPRVGGREGGRQDPGLHLYLLDHMAELWRTSSPLAGHIYVTLHIVRGPLLEKITLKSQKWTISYLSYQWDSQLLCLYWEKSETLSIFELERNLREIIIEPIVLQRKTLWSRQQI